MGKRLDVPDKGQFGPRYDVNGAALVKHRTLARNGLQAMTYEERRAYGAAVEAAVLAAQARALRSAGEPEHRPNCASRSWANAPGEVGEAVRQQQRRALAACAGQVRRARSDVEWATMYEAAMTDKARRIAEHLLAGGTLELAA